MAGIEIKSFEAPDELRPFEARGHVALETVAGKEIGRGVFEPGSRWSADVKPIAGTDSCEVPHFVHVGSGRMRVLMDDGTHADLKAGDVAAIGPGHDAEVLGDEPCVMVDLGEEDGDYGPAGAGSRWSAISRRAHRSETATSSSRSSASCRPASMPEATCASRCCLLECCTRTESVVRPCSSERVSVLSASPSGMPS